MEMHRRVSLKVAAVFLASVALGWGMAPGNPDVDVVHAACGTATTYGSDATVTSALQVAHLVLEPSIVPVEPDDSETWDIKAVWATQFAAACNCQEIDSTVSTTVTWTGSTWSASCTGCDATNGPIRSVSVCPVDSCTIGPATHGWSYKLIVDVELQAERYCVLNNTNEATYLVRVEYTTTEVDPGDIIDTVECDEVGAVSPTSQVWTATDYGSFECAFNCDSTGASTAIFYE